jgi:hypothetical protein
MASEIKANKISPATGTAFTIGDSGDTFTIPSGVTLTNNGTASGFGGVNTPAFYAGRTGSNQSIARSTYVKLQFNEESLDTHNAYDPTTNYRFTVPAGQAGKYFISVGASLSYSGGGLLNAWLYIYKNGAFYGNQHSSSSTYVNALQHSVILDLSVGDYIEGYCYVTGGTGDFLYSSVAPGMNHLLGFKLVE